jgi:hypothetical protein
MSFPRGRKAILVLHGIGQQTPFQTIEDFAAGYLQANAWDLPDSSIVLEHRVSRRTPAFSEPWLESYLRIRPADCETPDNPPDRIDIHEYYWAHETQRLMKPVEVFDWFYGVFDKALKFAHVNKEALDVKREVNRDKILEGLDELAVKLNRWRWFLRPLHWLATWWGRESRCGKFIWGLFEKTAGIWIAEYAADVAVYTAAEIKEKHFGVRQKILGGCIERLRNLLAKDENGRDFNESVVIAAHSLGSVVAYDAINRLQLFQAKAMRDQGGGDNPLRKITGFATFGSPLDKIYFYFRDQDHRYESVYRIRAQFVDHLYSFRLAIPQAFEAPGIQNHAGGRDLLPNLLWINYYNLNDPVSSYLLFYRTDDDVEVSDMPAEQNKFLVAHNAYWSSKGFFKDIHDRLVTRRA